MSKIVWSDDYAPKGQKLSEMISYDEQGNQAVWNGSAWVETGRQVTNLETPPLFRSSADNAYTDSPIEFDFIRPSINWGALLGKALAVMAIIACVLYFVQ